MDRTQTHREINLETRLNGAEDSKGTQRRDMHLQICDLHKRAEALGAKAVAESLKLAAMLLSNELRSKNGPPATGRKL